MNDWSAFDDPDAAARELASAFIFDYWNKSQNVLALGTIRPNVAYK